MIGVNSRHGCRLSGLSVCLSVLSEKELLSPSDTSFVEKSKFQSHVHPFVFTSSVILKGTVATYWNTGKSLWTVPQLWPAL